MEAHLCVRNNSYLIFVRNFQKNEPERRSGFKNKNRNAVPVRSGPIRTLPTTSAASTTGRRRHLEFATFRFFLNPSLELKCTSAYQI